MLSETSEVILSQILAFWFKIGDKIAYSWDSFYQKPKYSRKERWILLETILPGCLIFLHIFKQRHWWLLFCSTFFFNNIPKEFLDDRLCFLPELKSGLFTIQYMKDNVSFWGKGQAGLLMAHYKRCCIGLGPFCMTPVGIERQGKLVWTWRLCSLPCHE